VAHVIVRHKVQVSASSARVATRKDKACASEASVEMGIEIGLNLFLPLAAQHRLPAMC
jgi:hypothetical protein